MNDIDKRQEKPLAETKVSPPAKGPESLPNKPSDLILAAMDDLERIERTPGYKVDMGIWHDRAEDDDGESCYVCMAGSVIAGSLGADPNVSHNPSNFIDRYDTEAKLSALDDFRDGAILVGVERLCERLMDDNLFEAIEEIEDDIDFHPYPDMFHDLPKEKILQSPGWQTQRKKFGRYMYDLADRLKNIGL